MTDAKYDRYFFSGLRDGQSVGRGLDIAVLDSAIMKGSNYYRLSRMQPNPEPHNTPLPPRARGPHIHKYGELLMHLGTNPNDPFDLGAEVELCMGKEMEPHLITRSTVVYIPANFIHSPWIVKRAWRPWIFIQINQGPMHTEKNYPQLLPKELRETMIFDPDVW